MTATNETAPRRAEDVKSAACMAVSNSFDRLSADVKALYEKYPPDVKSSFAHCPGMTSGFRRFYRNSLLPPGWRLRLQKLFTRIGFDRDWFEEFSVYWSRILGGRPLWGPEDFHFLRNTYRVRFQNVSVPDEADSAAHLQAWQSPDTLYFLLHQAYKQSIESKMPLLQPALAALGRLPECILEYGCGAAPVCRDFFDYHEFSGKTRFLLADIATLAFHYGAFQHRHEANIIPVVLTPDADYQLLISHKVDIIFCLEVFEHLDQPLRTVKNFHEILSAGGILVFDYILGEGKGLDTRRALVERPKVLDFIASNFDMIHGKPAGCLISAAESTGPTIVRRK